MLTNVLEAPGLQEWFKESTDLGNPDALLLALKIREKVHVDSTMFGNLLPQPFSATKLFSSDHLTSLVECFKVILIYIYVYQISMVCITFYSYHG